MFWGGQTGEGCPAPPNTPPHLPSPPPAGRVSRGAGSAADTDGVWGEAPWRGRGEESCAEGERDRGGGEGLARSGIRRGGALEVTWGERVKAPPGRGERG